MSGGDAIVILKSAERTATESGEDFNNAFGRGIHLFLDITAAGGTTPTLDVKVQRKDALSGAYLDMPGAAFAQKTGTGSDDLTIYPGVTPAANRSVSGVLSQIWRVVATIGGDTPTFTFSVGGDYIE